MLAAKSVPTNDLELTSTSSRGNDDLSSVGGILDGIAEQNLHEYGQLALISHHDGEIGIKHRSKRQAVRSLLRELDLPANDRIHVYWPKKHAGGTGLDLIKV